MNILVLNSGSSSQKASLFGLHDDPHDAFPEFPQTPVWQGSIEWRKDRVTLQTRTSAGKASEKDLTGMARTDATTQLINCLVSGETQVLAQLSQIDVAGHRIVNGGASYNRPSPITLEVKAAIEKMAVFAPLHNRVQLEGVALIERLCGAALQVAVFDTDFHSQLPEAVVTYPGPYNWVRRGIRKFGFHGINHEYCAERAAQLLAPGFPANKLVTCHLGNGCSLTAILDGRSIETTMGFTPLDGLMMGTRCGSLDPGILTFLLREHHIDAKSLDAILNEESGLLGISGISSDMREILAAIRGGNARAQLAFDMFVHHLRTGMGSMVAALDGVDAFVFSGGIGEHSPEVRAAACANFTFLALALDPAKNFASHAGHPDRDIAKPESKVRVLIVRAQEDWAIARACLKFTPLRDTLQSKLN